MKMAAFLYSLQLAHKPHCAWVVRKRVHHVMISKAHRNHPRMNKIIDVPRELLIILLHEARKLLKRQRPFLKNIHNLIRVCIGICSCPHTFSIPMNKGKRKRIRPCFFATLAYTAICLVKFQGSFSNTRRLHRVYDKRRRRRFNGGVG